MDPAKESFWNIEGTWIFYTLAAISVLVALFAIYRHYRRWKAGRTAGRFNQPGKRLAVFLGYLVIEGLFHRKFFGADRADWRLREFYPGLIHFFIFSGIIVLFLATVLDFFNHYFAHFLEGNTYLAYSVLADSFGILVIIGVLMAIVRRYVQKPPRLDNRRDDLAVLLMLLAIVLTGFLVEGFRIAATELQTNPGWAPWSPGGYTLARAFSGLGRDALLGWHAGLWWLHIVLSLGIFVYVALFNSKLFHVIWDPVNAFFRSLEPKGALTPVDFETTELFGVSKIEDFTWKQLLDLDACTRCGRCQDACPAFASGKVLNPKQVIINLKDHLYEVFAGILPGKPADSRKDVISEVVTDEAIWDCTTCRACMQACPVYIEHVDKIIDLRRNLAMEQSRFPEAVQSTLKSLNDRGHPFRGTTATRTTWAEGFSLKTMADDADGEILYWVGCTAALEDRNMKVAVAMAKIMTAAGVNFRILGEAETCCGDPARRLGDEYLFQTICQGNIEILKAYNVQKIVTACPHCFNTLKHEYPQFGGNYEVVHHTQFIADLLRQGKLKLNRTKSARIAYHDSCYLGRYNDVYQEPRTIVKSLGGTESVELGRSGRNSFCCGGGGGHMWMEEDPDKRVSNRRVGEIVAAGAEIAATACPYCMTMFEDGIKAAGKEESLVVRDLAELVAEALAADE